MKVYKEMHATIKTMLADDDHLSGATTFDIWTDQYSRRSFIGMTYHYIDQLFTLSKALLSATGNCTVHSSASVAFLENLFNNSNAALLVLPVIMGRQVFGLNIIATFYVCRIKFRYL